MWITLNEPICSTYLGYGIGMHAPGIKDPLNAMFKTAHTLIRAHTKAYRTYESKYKAQQKGMLGSSYYPISPEIMIIRCLWNHHELGLG